MTPPAAADREADAHAASVPRLDASQSLAFPESPSSDNTTLDFERFPVYEYGFIDREQLVQDYQKTVLPQFLRWFLYITGQVDFERWPQHRAYYVHVQAAMLRAAAVNLPEAASIIKELDIEQLLPLESLSRALAVTVEPVQPQEARTPLQWGPPIWRWLHYLSFFATDDVALRELLGIAVLNLQRMLICGECYAHYLEMRVRDSTVLPLLFSGDCVTPLFQLHNAVNRRKYAGTSTPEGAEPPRVYPLAELCALYGLTLERQRIVRLVVAPRPLRDGFSVTLTELSPEASGSPLP